MHRVADCIIGRVIPQPTEGQRIGDQINAAMMFTWSGFVNRAVQVMPESQNESASNNVRGDNAQTEEISLPNFARYRVCRPRWRLPSFAPAILLVRPFA